MFIFIKHRILLCQIPLSGRDFFSSDFIPASLVKNNSLWYDRMDSHVTENNCYCLSVKISLVWEKVREGLLSNTSLCRMKQELVRYKPGTFLDTP